MDEMDVSEMRVSGRINLAVPIDTMILIEKNCYKKGIRRTQFVLEAITEKLNNYENKELSSDIQSIKEDVKELKKNINLLLDRKNEIDKKHDSNEKLYLKKKRNTIIHGID